METFLSTFFQVLICVTMKSKAELVFTGTEGGSVEIFCKYPDGYQYNPLYFCRDPCTSSGVLIQSEKVDEVVSKGRYTALNTVSARSFSVTIKHLTLKDAGVYYCGVNKWGFDKLTKVKLTVSKVPTVSTRAPVSVQNQSSEVTQFSSATTTATITATADTATTYGQASTRTQTQHVLDSHGKLVVYGGVLGLMLCCVLAALVIIYRKKSSTHITSLKPAAPENQIPHTAPDQEDIFHVYDEMLAVYNVAGPAIADDSLATYSTIQLPAATNNECSPYSHVAPH